MFYIRFVRGDEGALSCISSCHMGNPIDFIKYWWDGVRGREIFLCVGVKSLLQSWTMSLMDWDKSCLWDLAVQYWRGENSELGRGSFVSRYTERRVFTVRLIYSVSMWFLQEFLRNVIYRRIHWHHQSTPPRPTHSVTWRSRWGATIAEIVAEAPIRMVVACTFPVDSVILIACIKIRSVNSSSVADVQSI